MAGRDGHLLSDLFQEFPHGSKDAVAHSRGDRHFPVQRNQVRPICLDGDWIWLHKPHPSVTPQMARDSKIQWTDHTFNPWWGCTKVSPACDHCYAEAWARRVGLDVWNVDRPRRFLSDNYWRQPHLWNKKARRNRHRPRVFCASMADVFEPKKSLSRWRRRLWTVTASGRLLSGRTWDDSPLSSGKPNFDALPGIETARIARTPDNDDPPGALHRIP